LRAPGWSSPTEYHRWYSVGSTKLPLHAVDFAKDSRKAPKNGHRFDPQ